MPRVWTLLSVLYFVPTVSHAQVSDPEFWRPPKTASELILDLEGTNKPERLFAARELRRLLKQTARIAGRRGDSLTTESARIELIDLRAALNHPTRRCVMNHANVRAQCAEILGLLGDDEAIDFLEAALELDERKRVKRRIEKAITYLENT
jgi:hypothetical protein